MVIIDSLNQRRINLIMKVSWQYEILSLFFLFQIPEVFLGFLKNIEHLVKWYVNYLLLS
ncbi:MAG: hypothetical protein ACI910_002193 [Oleispira sp.]|jgi:hypothetical protein